MTKAKVKTEVAVVEETTTALATIDFAADAGAGMEQAGADSFAIPFLSVLQKGSPQVDEASGVAIDGAKAGMIYDNVTGKLFNGKEGVVIVPAYYRRVFLRWGPANFKGEMSADVVAEMRAAGGIVDLDGKLYIPLPDGTVNPKHCDRISDTRNHYVLLLDQETGAYSQALVSLSSTQIKKSKMLMSALASVKVKHSTGMITPPTYANTVRMTTVPESNDKGTWFGVRFELTGFVNQPDVYQAAKAFHASVSKGAVEVKYAEEEAPASSGKF